MLQRFAQPVCERVSYLRPEWTRKYGLAPMSDARSDEEAAELKRMNPALEKENLSDIRTDYGLKRTATPFMGQK